MNLNLQELSRKAGVSIASVSRALNGKPGVSEKKRALIQKMAKDFGYIANPQASALRSKTRSGWTLLTSSSPSQITQHRNQHFLKTLREMAFSIQVITVAPKENFKTTLERIWQDPPAVLLVHGLQGVSSRELEVKGRDPRTTVISIDRNSKIFDSVCIDRAEGVRTATRLMLTGGVTSPAFLTSQSHSTLLNDERNQGIIKAYKDLGLKHKETDFHPIKEATSEMGKEVTLELLQSRFVDAIFCYSDQVGYGVLRALYEKGIKVPDEVRVIGFDDLPHSAMTTPSLTTVSQPVQEMVDIAISLALSRQNNPEGDLQTVLLPTRLIPRESCPIRDHLHREKTFLHKN